MLHISVKFWKRERRDPVKEERGIPLDQQYPQPLEQVPDALVLLLASAPCLGLGQLPQLVHCLSLFSCSCLGACSGCCTKMCMISIQRFIFLGPQ